MKRGAVLLVLAAVIASAYSADAQTSSAKGVLFTPRMMERARINAEKYPWASDIRKDVIDAAAPWLRYSDDELWDMMFGATITRSWMVWSDGFCPSCGKDVRMYAWKMDALARPWKVKCPNCGGEFPKNDFAAYHRSGLDEHGVFDPARADRSLLFNAEHPASGDSLRSFGVDDGEGYVRGSKRWRFIGAYLIYGQWKQAVQGGIRKLAAAHTVTGDPVYAHKAGVLLDRVADLYPSFDFGAQGIVYEQKGAAGYVSTWHDACEETRELITAWDQVRGALEHDSELVAFLSAKARKHHLENPKASFADIRRNIEDRILRDAIANEKKIHSNYPRTEVALTLAHMVLGGDEHVRAASAIIDDMVEKSTAVDGVTGEKGLPAYASYVITGLAGFIETFARRDDAFLPDLFRRHPNLLNTWRFHIDTWFECLYYPHSGDGGAFAGRDSLYAGARTLKSPGLEPSMFSFLVRLGRLTGDPAYLQVAWRENGKSAEALPRDLFASDPEADQKVVRDAVARHGDIPKVGSVNKEGWCIALMRSGTGANARAFWLDYDSGGRHSHADCMNLGLYAKGLDLLPDMGYPPVQYGGWESEKALWYRKTAAHNTVVVDGRDQKGGGEPVKGTATLWADGSVLRAIRASAPDVNGIKRFERTVAMVDVSERDSYLVDVFRVAGGSSHVLHLRTGLGTIRTQGFRAVHRENPGPGEVMRNILTESSPKPGWSVEWTTPDGREGYADTRLRFTDLTAGAVASTEQSWVSTTGYDWSAGDAWIPGVMVRSFPEKKDISTTFASVIEPFDKKSNISRIRRLDLARAGGTGYAYTDVLVELKLASGGSDLVAAIDPEYPGGGAVESRAAKFSTDAELAFVRKDAKGRVVRAAVSKGSVISCGAFRLELGRKADYIELDLSGGRAKVVSGDRGSVRSIASGGKLLVVE